MASKIKHSFKEGCLALVKGGWANRVGRFCSYWCGVNGVDVLVPENPSPNAPVKVGLNIANATKLIVNEMTGNLGIKFDAAAHPLQLRLVTKTQNNAQVADYAAVYLPTTTIRIKGTDYTVTGVTEIENGGGWYKITNRTIGYFYLNQSGSTTNLVWATSALSDTTKASYFVGRITYSQQEGWNVIQYCRPMSGKAVAQDEGGSGGGELPADNLTGTLVNGRLVKGTGSHTAASSVFAPPAGHQLVVAPENMSGNANCLPIVTQNASITQSAALANSGIAVIDMATKKAISGINVKIEAPSGVILEEWDNVAVAADGTLKLDQTDYAWFDPDEDTIIDEGIVVASGTDGKVKTLEKLGASKVKIDEEGTTLEDLINSETSKIADTALDLFEEEGGEFYIDFDNTAAYVGDGNALVGTSADGLIQEACDIPQNPTTDKVLMVKTGKTTPSFEDATSSSSKPVPFQIEAETIQSGGQTILSYWKIYLPSLTVRVGTTDYAVQTGTGSGQVMAISGQNGWYHIYGISNTTLYFNDCSTVSSGVTTFKAKFANAALTTENTMSRFVATLAFSAGNGTVIQFPSAHGGNCRIGEPLEHAKEYNRFFVQNDGGDSQTRLPSGKYLDPNGWKRDNTRTMSDTTSGSSHAPTQLDSKFSGIRFQVVSRVLRAYDEDFFFWRWAYFDKNGMLIEVSPEQGVYAEVNYDAYG